MTTPEQPAPTKRRRAYGSVRPSLIESARKVFAERGYAGATTREIAQQAGATERLLFHHFGSKLGLFQAAVLEPFNDLVQEMTEGLRSGHRPTGSDLPMRDIVERLYSTLRHNRDISLAVVNAHEQGFEPSDDSVLARIGPTMTIIHNFVADEARAGHWRDADLPIVVGNVMGMITAAAVFKDYFFVHHPDASDDAIIDELTALIVNGLIRAHEPPSQAQIDHQVARDRVVISGPNAVVVTRAAAQWTASWGTGVPISDMSWKDLPHLERVELWIYLDAGAPSTDG